MTTESHEWTKLDEYRYFVKSLERTLSMSIISGGMARSGKIDPLQALKEAESMTRAFIMAHGNGEFFT